jgi:hypothetical protein
MALGRNGAARAVVFEELSPLGGARASHVRTASVAGRCAIRCDRSL